MCMRSNFVFSHMICFVFFFVLLFNNTYFVPECLDPAEYQLVLSQRDPPTAVHTSIKESPPSKRSNMAIGGMFFECIWYQCYNLIFLVLRIRNDFVLDPDPDPALIILSSGSCFREKFLIHADLDSVLTYIIKY